MNKPIHSKAATELEIASDEPIIVLRTAQQHQVRLTLLADQKANINIGFTLFFVTLNQGQIAAAIGEGGWVRAAAMLLFLSIAASLILALIVVLPRTGKQKITRPEDMTNPLYFGMFSQVAEQDYVDYLVGSLDGNLTARRVLARDIYQIGRVLARKYRLLRQSYSFLAVGVGIAVLLFLSKTLPGSLGF